MSCPEQNPFLSLKSRVIQPEAAKSMCEVTITESAGGHFSPSCSVFTNTQHMCFHGWVYFSRLTRKWITASFAFFFFFLHIYSFQAVKYYQQIHSMSPVQYVIRCEITVHSRPFCMYYLNIYHVLVSVINTCFVFSADLWCSGVGVFPHSYIPQVSCEVRLMRHCRRSRTWTVCLY